MTKSLRRLTLTKWIMICMVLGVIVGWAFPEFSQHLKVLSNIFLRLIKSIIVPIIFGTLVVGIAGHGGDAKSVGRLALKTIIYFEIVTTLALVVGLIVVNVLKPGRGVTLPPPSASASEFQVQKLTTAEVIEHIVPKSFFEAAATNDVLQVVFFSILFGVALTQVSGKPRETMLAFCEGISETMFKFTSIVMKFAPIGVGAAIAYSVAHNGLGVLKNLGFLVLTLYVALVIFSFIVLLPVALIMKIPVAKFLRAVREPALLAFSTTSSEAALPDAIKQMVRFGVPQRIVSFVIPAGYSFNLDGTTLHLAVASIFVAQAAGKDLPWQTQVWMMLTLMLTSKGVAGVPRASLVILSGTLASFGLPLEGVVLIIGVDELMDMARTTVNLVGNCLASAVVAQAEGQNG